ncbi:hypothetical protein NDU88_005277, partial [Pleurodeles waltl]
SQKKLQQKNKPSLRLTFTLMYLKGTFLPAPPRTPPQPSERRNRARPAEELPKN